MKKSKGLGDTVEKITTKTGIKSMVEWMNKTSKQIHVSENVILGDGKDNDDCGCNKRKEKLNKLFPYGKQD